MSEDQDCQPSAWTWRVSVLGRTVTWLCTAALVAGSFMVAFIARTPGARVGDVMASLVLLMTAVGFWRFGIYPRITATPQRLTVRNPILTRRLSWEEVGSVTPGYSGIAIKKSDGKAITAWAVQQANFSTWLNRPTSAKSVSHELMELANQWGRSGAV